MFFKTTRWCALPLFVCLSIAFPVHSQVFDPPMPDPLKRKADMSKNWQFYKGTPTGTPQALAYNDSGTGWSKIVVPHSCSYDSAPIVVTSSANWAAENNYYKGDCWYRKTFGVPLSAKKLFVEFEGAMQVATVYVNGTQVGIHNNSGYTPFVFDISGYITRGANNVVAVMLHNSIDAAASDIPPGTTTGRPDYLLYSGLYREVWLHSKDSVYIPIYSQFIQTVNVSAASAQIHALTPVKNDRTTAQTISVMVTLLDAAQATVGTPLTAALSIPANTLDTFDMTPVAFANPHLWSPSSPYMYSVQTLVRVGGVVVDSVVEPCGFRWITWASDAAGSFNLNGSRLEIRGMCVHQFEGWIENAVPATRYWQEVKLLKDLGCNSIRCSHYPRSQSFFDACDKLGMLAYVEIPSWGWGYTPSTTWWARADSCVKEMILSERNHPSVYLWGLYNEPIVSGNFSSQIGVLNNTAHALDPTRFTAEANIKTFNQAATVPDVEGLNYTTTGTAGAYRWLGTESRNTGTFTTSSYRGSSIDLDTTTDMVAGTAYEEWTQMSFTLNTTGQLSGGHFWCFKEYNSPCNLSGGEGVVDRFTVPKTMFYMYRKYWTGAAPDYPRPGTATTIQLLSDTAGPLRANGANIFLITTTLRDGAGHQISSATGNVTYTVAPASAGTIFGGNVQPAYAGRAGVFLRTTTIPATITVTAAYTGLTTQQITLTTIKDTNWVPPYTASAVKVAALLSSDVYRLKALSTAKGLVLRCPPSAGILTIVNCMGRTLYRREVTQGEQVFITRHTLGSGLLHAVWEGSGRRVSSRVNVM